MPKGPYVRANANEMQLYNECKVEKESEIARRLEDGVEHKVERECGTVFDRPPRDSGLFETRLSLKAVLDYLRTNYHS